jgi:hypothetical protein
MKTECRGFQVLNRDVLKYIAAFTMVLNHIAHMQLFDLSAFWCEVFTDIGYFTAPIMCYFLVEGYAYTKSKERYGFRLLVFALLSQIPFRLAFHNGLLNMMFTLYFCFMILTAMEKIQNTALRDVVCLALTMATLVCDWALVAPILTILLHKSRGDRKRTACSFGIIYAVFVLLSLSDNLSTAGDFSAIVILRSLASGIGILMAAFAVLVFYNGRRMNHGQTFSKWFFYLFYPAHLLLLYLIKT